MIIFKVFRVEEFLELEENGYTVGTCKDKADGFIHFSTKDQLIGTLKTYFRSESDLVMMAIDSNTVQNLKWEASRDNEAFPHLYSKLNFCDALWFAPIELMEDRHILPSGF